MLLFGLLPYFGLLLTAVYFIRPNNFPFEAVIKGATLWGGALILSTHVLSLLHLLYFLPVFLFWSAYSLCLLCMLAGKSCKPSFRLPGIRLLLPVCVPLAVTFALALLYPPNTWDSMTYHMPKVMHWWQEHSQAFHFTGIIRQNVLTPGAETIIFHSLVLSGGDRLANLVQWAAFAGGICAVYSTAALLGAGTSGRMAGCVFAATIPMAVAQASSTQTDLAVSFWLICLANRAIAWKLNRTHSNALFCGLALGLALATKGTAYHFSLPFVSLIAFYAFCDFRRSFTQAALAAAIALLCFAPHILRVHYTYADLSTGVSGNIIAKPDPRSFAATATANIIVNTPKFSGNDSTVDKIYYAALAGLGINKDDPALFPYGPLEKRSKLSLHEDTAHNPLHMLGALFCLFCFLPSGRKPEAALYKRCFAAGVFLFCLLIPWQPWITRLQLPVFILAAPLVGLQIERRVGTRLQAIILMLMLLGAAPMLAWNKTRPLVPGPGRMRMAPNAVWFQEAREAHYFNARPELYGSYADAAELIAALGPERVWLYTGGDSWEYPLWPMLAVRMEKLPEISHLPEKGIEQMAQGAFSPASRDVLVVIEKKLPDEKKAPGEYLRVFRCTPHGLVALKPGN